MGLGVLLKRWLRRTRLQENIAYCINQNQLKYLAPMDVSAPRPLPDDLFIQPGHYLWHGKIYELREEGLYRFVIPRVENAQRILFTKDVRQLLSSIAWIASHGNRDDRAACLNLIKTAKKDKLSLTCQRVCEFAKFLLESLSIHSRLVFGEAELKGYDGGHVMLEVFMKDTKKWVLFDLDMNFYFTRQGRELSYLEFLDFLPTGDFQMHSLARDCPLDLQFAEDGFKFHFLMEATLTDMKCWYQKVCAIGILSQDGRRIYIGEQKNQKDERLEFFPRESIREKFYADADAN